MTNNHSHQPADQPSDDQSQTDRPAADPFRPGRLACPCGAVADRDGLCRKCRARAIWGRRAAGRRAHIARPPTRRPDTCRPRGRHIGR